MKRSTRMELAKQTVEIVVESAAHVAHRRGHRRAPGGLAGDDEMADLVEQPQGADLPGGDAGGLGRSRGVHPRRELTDGCEIRDGKVAAQGEHDVVDAVALSRRPPDVERADAVAAGARVAHAGRMARALHGRQTADSSAGRSEATWSIARRSSSSPDGSNS